MPTHTSMCQHTRIYPHTCIHAGVLTQTHTDTHTHTHIHTHTHTYTYTHIFALMHKHLHTCARALTRKRAYKTKMHSQTIRTYTHNYTHTLTYAHEYVSAHRIYRPTHKQSYTSAFTFICAGAHT